MGPKTQVPPALEAGGAITPVATIVIPTHEHGPTLRYAMPTALGQTVQDVEVFVIGDGVSDQGRAVIEQFAGRDERVRLFDHPKHERRGEPYRHAALQEARGQCVLYLCDRDLWLPHHVEHMVSLLEDADFAGAFTAHVSTQGDFRVFAHDLSDPRWRRFVLTKNNRLAFSCAGHTLAMYRALPFGWRTTPTGVQTDLYMWRQFLSQRSCRAVSGHEPTALTFPSPRRLDWPTGRRLDELERWTQQISSEQGRLRYKAQVLEAAYRQYQMDLGVLMDVRASGYWRLRRLLRRLTGLKPLD